MNNFYFFYNEMEEIKCQICVLKMFKFYFLFFIY